MAVSIYHEMNKINEVMSVPLSLEVAVKSNLYMDELLETVHSHLSSLFVKQMSVKALANPKEYGHLYEWGYVGNPLRKLWMHTLTGSRAKVAGFVFLPSRTIVPVPEALAEIGVEEKHYFTWKAPIIEYGLPVTVRRKNAPVLVFLSKTGGIVRSKLPVHIPQQGEPGARGAFTREFTEFYSGSTAADYMDGKILRPQAEVMESASRAEIRKAARVRNKKVKMQVATVDPGIARKLRDSLTRRLRSRRVEE